MTIVQLNDLLAVIIGAVLPPIISWVKGSTWSAKQRLLLALAVCAVVGTLQVLVPVFVAGAPLSYQTIASNIGLIFTACTASYKLFYKTTPPAVQDTPVVPS